MTSACVRYLELMGEAAGGCSGGKCSGKNRLFSLIPGFIWGRGGFFSGAALLGWALSGSSTGPSLDIGHLLDLCFW